MTASAVATSVDEAVSLLRAGVDGLLDGSLSALSSGELLGLLDAVETEARRLGAVDARMLSEIDDRGIAGDYGRTSTLELLTTRLRVAPREAKARVRRAQALAPRRSVSGEPIEAQLPIVAAALRDGEISTGHVSAIVRVLDRADRHLAHLPDPADAHESCERLLVESARHEHPAGTERTGQLLLTRLNPDGPCPDNDRHRGFTLSATGDGSSRPSGQLNAECTALWQTILDTLAAPRPTELDDGQTVPDERTGEQRRHDAMLEAARTLLRSGALPDCGGVPATLVITTTTDELARAGGVVRTAHGALIPADQIHTLAGDLDIDLAVLAPGTGTDTGTGTGTGTVLAYGRTRRTATARQRTALAVRDGAGCCFPGCSRPLAWTQAHHLVRWEHGGTTDLDNLCLVCTHHHRLLDHGDWHVIMADDGRPSWLPPPWIDPHGIPLRNTAHHLPAIEFDPGG